MTAIPNLTLHGTAMPRLGFGTWRLASDALRAEERDAISNLGGGPERHVSPAFEPAFNPPTPHRL